MCVCSFFCDQEVRWPKFHNNVLQTSDMLFRVRPICSAKLLVVYVCTPNKECDHGSFGCCRDLSFTGFNQCYVLLVVLASRNRYYLTPS